MYIKASNNEFRRENTESNECTKRKLVEIVCEISINKFLFRLSVNMLKISPIIPPIQWKRFIAFDCIICVSLIWWRARCCLEIFLSHSLYVAVVVVCVALYVFSNCFCAVKLLCELHYFCLLLVGLSSTLEQHQALHNEIVLIGDLGMGGFINEMFGGFVFCLFYLKQLFMELPQLSIVLRCYALEKYPPVNVPSSEPIE